jgi:hypothetical protein
VGSTPGRTLVGLASHGLPTVATMDLPVDLRTELRLPDRPPLAPALAQ